MKVLLDTNIVIHREASTVVKENIGVLFRWLDALNYTKCIHRLTAEEIRKHKDPKVVATFSIKLSSYTELQTEAPISTDVEEILLNDKDDNSRNDTSVVNEVFLNRVDFLITEDRGIHRKAKLLGVDDRVFTIDGFLEKVTAEHPSLSDYNILAVRRALFGNIDVKAQFFDSFRRDYLEFDAWFNRKAEEAAYVCYSEKKELEAFLYLKVEESTESYHDIAPSFLPKRRLKIGTFKVVLNGYKLGERFLKIVFDNALRQKVSEIYVTIFAKDTEQQRLVALLLDWGFTHHGSKKSSSGEEMVLVRGFSPVADPSSPAMTFPYMSGRQRKFIVPIYPEYHTELLPDSILRTEDPENFEGNRPNRNALRKVYISRSIQRDMKTGDILVFYRTAKGGAGYYTSVATTLGIVESVITSIPSLDRFIALCRKRSVFTDSQLAEHWNHNPKYRPFVVNFIHTHSFPKRPNFKALSEEKIISEAPRGFAQLTDDAFLRLLHLSNANQSLIVD